MKKITQAFVVGILLFAGACSQNGSTGLRDSADTLSYIVGMNVARNLIQMDSTLRPDAVCQAIHDVFQKQTLMSDEQARRLYLRHITYEIPEKVRAYEEQFLEDIRRDNRSYVRTNSGLTYMIEAIGDDLYSPASQKDTLLVRYVMRTIDGKELYSSYDRGDTLRMPLGQMLKGMQESVKLIGKGGKINAWLPAATAYGAEGDAAQGVEPDATLFVEIELIDLRKEVRPKSYSGIIF